MDRLSDYDYNLPPELIAQEPLQDRAASRLLVLERSTGKVSHLGFRDFPSLLRAGDVLVLNETRVTAVRLHGVRQDSGGAVELLVLRRGEDDSFECLAKPAKRLHAGVQLEFSAGLTACVTKIGEGGIRQIEFNQPELLQEAGQVPLPPYITTALPDAARYQTVYAGDAGEGSAAAPTAGLHFTPEILQEIKSRGISIAKVCLDVGIDTFRPVQVEDLADHSMHGEKCTLPPDAAKVIAGATGRVVAVGTTSVRTLESFAREKGSQGHRLIPGTITSKLFLRPGSQFLAVDAMLTNFHLPRTTMLVMLSAFCGREHVMAAHAQAVAEKYRFLSFGDAMFIL